MTAKEKQKMTQLFKEHPVLMEKNWVKTIFTDALSGAIEQLNSDLTKEEKVELLGETLLEVEELIAEIKGKQTVTLN